MHDRQLRKGEIGLGVEKESPNEEITDDMADAFTTKKVGDMTYRVKVYFSKDATETMQEKLERMLRNEVLQAKEIPNTG